MPVLSSLAKSSSSQSASFPWGKFALHEINVASGDAPQCFGRRRVATDPLDGLHHAVGQRRVDQTLKTALARTVGPIKFQGLRLAQQTGQNAGFIEGNSLGGVNVSDDRALAGDGLMGPSLVRLALNVGLVSDAGRLSH